MIVMPRSLHDTSEAFVVQYIYIYMSVLFHSKVIEVQQVPSMHFLICGQGVLRKAVPEVGNLCVSLAKKCCWNGNNVEQPGTKISVPPRLTVKDLKDLKHHNRELGRRFAALCLFYLRGFSIDRGSIMF